MRERISKRRVELGVGFAIGVFLVGGCKSTAKSSGEQAANGSSVSSISPEQFDIKGIVVSKGDHSLTLGSIVIESPTGSSASTWFKKGEHELHDSYQTRWAENVKKGSEKDKNGLNTGISSIHIGDTVEATGSLTESYKSTGVMEQQPVFDVVTDESR